MNHKTSIDYLAQPPSLLETLCVEDGSVDHDVGIILRLGQGVVVVVDVHLDSLAQSLV